MKLLTREEIKIVLARCESRIAGVGYTSQPVAELREVCDQAALLAEIWRAVHAEVTLDEPAAGYTRGGVVGTFEAIGDFKCLGRLLAEASKRLQKEGGG